MINTPYGLESVIECTKSFWETEYSVSSQGIEEKAYVTFSVIMVAIKNCFVTPALSDVSLVFWWSNSVNFLWIFPWNGKI